MSEKRKAPSSEPGAQKRVEEPGGTAHVTVVSTDEVFERLSARLCGAATSGEVMGALSEEGDLLFRWDCCFLAHVLPGRNVVRIAYNVDTENGVRKVYPGEECRTSHLSAPFRRALSGERLLINRAPGRSEPAMVPVGTGRPCASLMFVPVRSRDTIIGVFTVQSYTQCRYSESDLEILQRFADMVAPALERVNAVDALRASEARYRVLVEQIPAITYTDPFGDAARRGAYVSPQIRELLDGADVEHETFHGFLQSRLHPQDRDRVLQAYAAARERGEGFVAEYRIVAHDQRVLWFRDVAAAVRDEQGRLLCLQGVVTDITERKRAEAALRRAHDELEERVHERTAQLTAANAELREENARRLEAQAALRNSTAQAEKSLEEERARISRELHDELGQSVTALNMLIVSLERQAVGMEDSAREQVGEMREIAGRILQSVRDLARSLRPAVLERAGVVEVLRAFVADFEKRYQIACRIQLDVPELPADDVLTVTVFRVVQEALTNVARHSRAQSCEVSMTVRDDRLEVRVQDDGVGAPRAALSGGNSLGLTGMRERVAAAGGTLHVESRKGQGVRVTAVLPLPAARGR
jgi:PAS domain S-box-containing protein